MDFPQASAPNGDQRRLSNHIITRPRGGIPTGAGVREDVYKIWFEHEECRRNLNNVEFILNGIPETKTSPG